MEIRDEFTTLVFRSLQFTLYLSLLIQTIVTSVFLIASMRYKQYLYYVEYWWKLLLQSFGMFSFLVLNMVHVLMGILAYGQGTEAK